MESRKSPSSHLALSLTPLNLAQPPIEAAAASVPRGRPTPSSL